MRPSHVARRPHRYWLPLLLGLVLVVGVLVLTVPRATAEPTSRPAPKPPALGTTSDYVIPAGVDGRRRIRKWPGHVIRYHETIPAKWDWGLRHAIAAWNESGSKLRFVKAPAGSAQLTISYGDTGGADGMATLGHTRHAWVHLSPAYKTTRPDALMTVWVGRLFAHELGHVLGFGHTTGACSLMVPVFNLGTCPVLDAPGYYACRWIDKPLLTRFIAAYGGSARRPPATCLIDPLPPQLTGVAFSGGQAEDRAVRVRWDVPSSAPPGTAVRVAVWRASTCAARPPSSAREYHPALGTGEWIDPVRDQPGAHCFHVSAVNKWGAARPAFTDVRQRWWPAPAAPVIASVDWDATDRQYRLRGSVPAGAELYEYVDPDHPQTCSSDWPGDGLAVYLQRESAGVWLVEPQSGEPAECATFFAVSPSGAASDGVPESLEVPPPVVPALGSPTPIEPGSKSFYVQATVSAYDYLVGEVVPGPCAATPPANAQFFDLWDSRPDWEFDAEAEGANCLYVALQDWWGRRSATTAVVFSWTATAPPA
jgi:hypothetical protein